jgi:D-amino peptidase
VKNETIKAIKKVLESDISKINPLKLKTPITLRIELAKTSMADMVSLMPLVNRVGDRVIELVNDDYKVIFNAIIPIIVLSDVNF